MKTKATHKRKMNSMNHEPYNPVEAHKQREYIEDLKGQILLHSGLISLCRTFFEQLYKNGYVSEKGVIDSCVSPETLAACVRGLGIFVAPRPTCGTARIDVV